MTLESPLDCKEIQPVHSAGDQPWDLFGRTDAKAETPVLWPPHVKSWLIGKDWCWEGLGAGGEGDDRGWDGWMASLTQWTWVWANSRSWWWTERPGVLQFMGSQRVGHDWATELMPLCVFIYIYILVTLWFTFFQTVIKTSFSIYCKVCLLEMDFFHFFVYFKKFLFCLNPETYLCWIWDSCFLIYFPSTSIPLYTGLYYFWWKVSSSPYWSSLVHKSFFSCYFQDFLLVIGFLCF